MKILNKSVVILLLSCFCVLSINMIQKNRNSSDEMSLIVSKKEPSAFDKADGQLKIVVKGGKAPYKLTIHTSTKSNESVFKGEIGTFDLKDLPKGFYLLNVTDSENNFTSQSINL